MLRLIVDLKPSDPSLGLALEEALLESSKSQGIGILRFWINDRSVIIGRSQSAAREADLNTLHSRSIPVIRRLSGGGAVYHYPGNLNISAFMTADYQPGTISQTYASFGQVFVRMLSQLKVKAEANGNSILIRDKKIAGAAQVRRQGLVLYHISFLVRPPAAPIERFLLAMKDGYHTSLVASRPMPIMWLTQVVPQVTANGLISPVTNALSKILGFELEEDSYSEQELERARILQKEKYTSNTWNLSY